MLACFPPIIKNSRVPNRIWDRAEYVHVALRPQLRRDEGAAHGAARAGRAGRGPWTPCPACMAPYFAYKAVTHKDTLHNKALNNKDTMHIKH